MVNTSGLHPLGRAVLVATYEIEADYKGSIIIPDAAKGRDAMIEQRAIVIEVGECAWDDERTPRAKPGDHVLVTKFAGFMAIGINDKKPYRLINDRDIFARIDEEGK
jgi:co-chaperonin GroES (HSP10)